MRLADNMVKFMNGKEMELEIGGEYASRMTKKRQLWMVFDKKEKRSYEKTNTNVFAYIGTGNVFIQCACICGKCKWF